MRIVSVLTLVIIAQIHSNAQFSYWQDRFLPAIDIESYPEFHFEWNMPGPVQASLNAGITELTDEKDYEKAIFNFDKAIADMPSLPASFYYRGVCYKQLQQFKKAEEDFKSVLKLMPKRAEAYIELGEIYQLRLDFANASKAYQNAIKLQPLLVHGYYSLASLRKEEGNYAAAKRFYKKCAEVNPKFPKSYLQHALLIYKSEKNLDEVFELIAASLEADSTCNAAYFLKGMIHAHSKRYELALESWNKLIQYNPTDDMLIIMRALLYMDIQDFDRAFADLKKVLSNHYVEEKHFQAKQSVLDRKLDLQFALNYFSSHGYGLKDEAQLPLKRGFCLLFGRDELKTEAIACFKLANQIEPSGLGHFFTGIAYEHTKKHDSAFVYYNIAVKYDKDIFDAHKKLAIYNSELKDWRATYRHFAEMERIDPSELVTYRLRGHIRTQFKDFYGGIIDFTKFIKSDTANSEVYFMRGVCFRSVGDYKNANQDFRKSFELGKQRFDAAEQVIYTHLELRDTTSALEALHYYQKQLERKYFAVDMQLDILVKSKKYEEARMLIQLLLDTNEHLFLPRDLSIFFFYDGLIDYNLANYIEANSKFEKAIRADENNIDAQYYRGKTWMALGNTKKAINCFKKTAEVQFKDSQSVLDSLLASDVD